MPPMPLLLLMLAVFVAATVAGFVRPRLSSAIAAIAAAAGACLLAVLWADGGGVLLDVAWLPSFGSRFLLAMDPLAAPLVLFTTALAVPVLAYTAAYLPHHLEDHGRPPAAEAHFAALMLGFVLAMALLILAQDLLLIFLALEFTALASFMLIRFDRNLIAARRASLLALVVTAGGSLLFLVGAILISIQTGTTQIPELRAGGNAGSVSPVAVACLVTGVIGKSAQVPLHFWLPRAMVAPTPVSAYLHSAALVAAGVFVLQRLRFLLEQLPWLLETLFWLGMLSIVVGALLSLAADQLKRILAYSTIAQYGYCVVLVAIGSSYGAVGAAFFLVAHGLAKCALFMTAGAVMSATGKELLSECSGLGRRMPLLAAASGIAAAGLAGLPLTIGWFKDELLLGAALERGPVAAFLAAAAVALTLAYTARFWIGLFLGRSQGESRVSPGLAWPVAALAVLIVIGGLRIGPLQEAFEAAGQQVAGAPVAVELGYHAGTGLRLTLAAWSVGAAITVAVLRFGPALRGPAERLAGFGPAALADRVAAGGVRLSGTLHRLEVRDMRDRLTFVLVPTAAFVLLGMLPLRRWPVLGEIEAHDLPLACALLLVAGCAMVAARRVDHLTMVMLLSFLGLSLAFAFALAYAPDVALVLAVIDTAFTLLFLAVLAQIRPKVIRTARERMRLDRGPVAGIAAGAVATATAWLSLSALRPDSVAQSYPSLAEQAHAKDVVTAILTDFRGLDTAGELTVLVVAMFGAAAIVWGRRA